MIFKYSISPNYYFDGIDFGSVDINERHAIARHQYLPDCPGDTPSLPNSIIQVF